MRPWPRPCSSGCQSSADLQHFGPVEVLVLVLPWPSCPSPWCWPSGAQAATGPSCRRGVAWPPVSRLM